VGKHFGKQKTMWRNNITIPASFIILINKKYTHKNNNT